MAGEADAATELAFRGYRLGERTGEGASGVVHRATSARGEVAIKLAHEGTSPRLDAEAYALAKVARRWGPRFLEAGRLADGTTWIALEWIDGAPLDRRLDGDRARIAAAVAHGVARGLDELHRAGVRHGDVKPANILWSRVPTLDVAAERGATLVDLDLAAKLGDGPVFGGTPRYLAPEIALGGAPSFAADLWALGLVLAELVRPELAQEKLDSVRVIHALTGAPHAAWIEALLARSPGARPSAAWLADAAARYLDLRTDPIEVTEARRAQVRRAYLAAHEGGARGAQQATGVPLGWLREVSPLHSAVETHALDPLGRRRFLVGLVGVAAASWPQSPATDAELVDRLLDLAAEVAPEALRFEELVTARARSVKVDAATGDELWIKLACALAAPRPPADVLVRAEAALGEAPAALAFELAAALLRLGETGRAFVAIGHAPAGPETDLLRAEIARRRGDRATATAAARRASAAGLADGRALFARLSWDAGAIDAAEEEVEGLASASALEVRALVAYARGEYERGIEILESAAPEGELARARIDGTRGMLEHARGRARESRDAFARAEGAAARAGAVVEEATYLTGLAAAAVDAGDVRGAKDAAARAALLWERLDRPELAARAHLSRAAAYALVGATHEAELAANEVRARAGSDVRAAAFARWAIVESRPPGDPVARREASAASAELAPLGEEDALRARARLLVWAPDCITPAASDDALARRSSPTVRWEWWGARAQAPAGGERRLILDEIVQLIDAPAPIASRGPALAAAVALARASSDGELVRRLEAARRAVATVLREGTPEEHRATLASVAWLAAPEGPDAREALGGAQVEELEAIVRALSSRDRLKPLLAQVVDTMVLWTGVERGLLLLRAPDGRLVPRAARNLAREDLRGEQLTLSTGLAQRAIAERQPAVATDAFSQVGDLHASVHALGLRSVLALPLIARGDVLGVVYLDDRVRRGAFGPGELGWVSLVASQAALAIADARDQALLRRAVRRAERANDRLVAALGARDAELATVRAELAETRFRYDEITGRSEPMRAMLKLVDRVTTSDVPVLLAGESGTGKELVARAIHRNGPRGGRAFVSENCGSVPEALLESTLFGHVRGAFTGASSTRAGLFDIADGGTLFLDEIGEMPLAMQTKLLRVLQDGEVRPVGATRSRIVDVRIIGATHRDLEAMVAAGSFREDLFYRLNVVTIRIPPLRERGTDIPLLVSRFVEKYGPKERGGRRPKVTRAAMERLVTFPWPGNVRQLENEVRRALVLADDRIDVGELSEEVGRGGPSAARDAGLGLKARVDALESQLVREALAKNGGNQTRAAEVLGISRFGLQKMIRRLGIEKGPEKAPE